MGDLDDDFYPMPARPTLWLGDLYKQGYLAGQLVMRERAAHVADLWWSEGQPFIDEKIRALKPEEPK